MCHMNTCSQSQQQQQTQVKTHADMLNFTHGQQNNQSMTPHLRSANQLYNNSLLNIPNNISANHNNSNPLDLSHMNDAKNKGHSFSFDIASRDQGTPIQKQINNNGGQSKQQILTQSLQYDKDSSEICQKSTNNSQKVLNGRSQVDSSQINLIQPGIFRGGSFAIESENILKSSNQGVINYDSIQMNQINNDSANNFQKHQVRNSHFIGGNYNIPSVSSSPSHNISYETPQTFAQKLYGSNQIDSQKNINLAQLELTHAKKTLNGKHVNTETINLINFYNMFFNILPEGIAIIPLTNFPEKQDECQINQTLTSLLECDSKERCIQILSELRNSKVEEYQLASTHSNQLNQSNLNQSVLMNVSSNQDFVSQLRNDSIVSTFGPINQSDSNNTKKKKTLNLQNQVISSQTLKEDPPNLLDYSQDEINRENYINEKTRRITFVVDYQSSKKNKNNTSQGEITNSRKFSISNDTRNNKLNSSSYQESNKSHYVENDQEYMKGIPFLKTSNYQVQVHSNILQELNIIKKRQILIKRELKNIFQNQQNSSTKLTVMKEIEHIKKQLLNLKNYESYEMIGVHVRMVSKCKLDNDKVKYFEIIFIPCVIKSEITVVLVIKDITHFNEIEVLKVVNENKSQMLSQVAHEIRTPLNCVISMIEITKDLTDKQICENYLGPALTSARLLNNLIQDLLDMAQVKAGCFQLKSTKFNIRNLLDEVRQLMKIQAQSSNIQMEVFCQDTVPNSIYSDPFRIRQILINLIGNALKFTQKGFITVKADRHIHQNIDTIIKISVKDTGIGIKPKQKQKLFQAFGKLDDDNQETLNPKGVGLGLMISNELAKKLSNPVFNNQGLEVQSDEGQGSEFSFYIIDNVFQQASALHVSQKIVQPLVHDQKNEKAGKYKITSSSLHKIDEEQRENQSQLEFMLEYNGKQLQTQQASLLNTLNSQQFVSQLNNININNNNNNHNYYFGHNNQNNNIPRTSSNLTTGNYELYPNYQGYSIPNSHSPTNNQNIQNIIQNQNNNYINQNQNNNTNQTQFQNTNLNQNNNNQNLQTNFKNQVHFQTFQEIQKSNIGSFNSFDHNIENEESLANIINEEKYPKNTNLVQSANNTQRLYQEQDSISYSSAQSAVNTSNVEPYGQDLFQSQMTKKSQLFNLCQSEKNQALLQQQNTNSPTKFSYASKSQKKRQSVKSLYMQKYEDLDYSFTNVPNPLQDTREVISSKDCYDELTVKTKKEKQFPCKCNKILIVDDNTFNVYALQQLIKMLKQYECDTALSGEQAISCIQEKIQQNCCQKYKIIFMDIDMPQQSGLQTTSIIRRNLCNHKETKIIGCSGYSNTSQEYQNCIDAGMNDYLAKPIDKNHLKQILETCI